VFKTLLTLITTSLVSMSIFADSWTLAVIGDTHNHTDTVAAAQWLVDNAEAHNIKAVIHLGDFTTTQDWNVDTAITNYWPKTTNEFNRIFEADIPFFISTGNHDYYGSRDSVGDVLSTPINDYFPPNLYTNKPWFGGSFEAGHVENTFYTLSIEDEDYVFLNLEVWPRPEVLEWANGVLEDYSDHKAILTTHYFIAGASRAGPAENIYTNIVTPNPNVSMVFSGHTVAGRRTDVTPLGATVHQYSQNWGHQAGGWLRLVTVHPGFGVANVRTIKAAEEVFDTELDNNFTWRLKAPTKTTTKLLGKRGKPVPVQTSFPQSTSEYVPVDVTVLNQSVKVNSTTTDFRFTRRKALDSPKLNPIFSEQLGANTNITYRSMRDVDLSYIVPTKKWTITLDHEDVDIKFIENASRKVWSHSALANLGLIVQQSSNTVSLFCIPHKVEVSLMGTEFDHRLPSDLRMVATYRNRRLREFELPDFTKGSEDIYKNWDLVDIQPAPNSLRRALGGFDGGTQMGYAYTPTRYDIPQTNIAPVTHPAPIYDLLVNQRKLEGRHEFEFVIPEGCDFTVPSCTNYFTSSQGNIGYQPLIEPGAESYATDYGFNAWGATDNPQWESTYGSPGLYYDS
jgi:hypothetical protein